MSSCHQGAELNHASGSILKHARPRTCHRARVCMSSCHQVAELNHASGSILKHARPRTGHLNHAWPRTCYLSRGSLVALLIVAILGPTPKCLWKTRRMSVTGVLMPPTHRGVTTRISGWWWSLFTTRQTKDQSLGMTWSALTAEMTTSAGHAW